MKVMEWLSKNKYATFIILGVIVLIALAIIFNKISLGFISLIGGIFGWRSKKDDKKITKLREERKEISDKIQDSKDRQEKIKEQILINQDDAGRLSMTEKIDETINKVSEMSDEDYVKFLNSLK